MYIVTGASSGIGLAVAEALASEGCRVVAVARSLSKLRSLEVAFSAKIQAVRADLSSINGINAVVNAVDSAGAIKAIVHAAGSTIHLADYKQLLTDNLTEDLKVHVAAPIDLNNRLEAKLKGGRIVYLDSYSAGTPRVGWSGYSIIKAAAQMAARSAAAELSNSQVIRIFPGGVRTPLVELILNSKRDSPTVTAFKAFDAEGKIVEANVIGKFIANIILKATDEQLNAREHWDFNNPENRLF